MDINLFSLRVFCTIAERGSFSKAAVSLHLTQPAVTHRIKSLEDFFNTRLLNRTREGVKLTKSGEVVYNYAKQFWRLSDDLKYEISRCSGDLKSGFTLNIGACTTTGGYIFPGIIAAFKKEHPETEISLEVSNSSIIIEHILNGDLHLGWMCNPTAIKNKNVEIEEFGREPLCLIAPANYSTGLEQKMALKDLTGQKFIMKHEDCGIKGTIAKYFLRDNIKLEDLKIVMTVSDTGAIKEVVEAGMGLAIVPKRTVVKEIESGALKEIELKGESLWQGYWLVYTPQTIKTAEVSRFLDFMKTYHA
ncbi:MAG: LysR family transcriptional regulator [Desulfobacterales bacterium]|nr:LysR family transcriptional regulator [Desulfobacterales bacterium]